MSKASFALLASLPDQDEKDALIASQRRWLKARGNQDGSLYNNSPGGFGGVLERQAEDRRALFVSRAGSVPIAVARMERQRALLFKYPGRLSGFGADCFILPPNFADGIYECEPIVALQKGDRLCRWDVDWATGSESEVWTVAKVEGDRASLVATCKIGFYEGSNCESLGFSDEEVGWARTPTTVTPKMSDLAKNIRPLDPDVDPELNARIKAWLSEVNFPAKGDFVKSEMKKGR